MSALISVASGMQLTIYIPDSLVLALRKRGLDVEAVIVDALLEKLRLDPKERVGVHIELAVRYLEEGKKLVNKDPTQASEKLYKAAEEAIKALVFAEGLSDIISRVEERGRWTVTDLDRAARLLAKRHGKWVLQALSYAWDLHVWGFHEAKFDSEAVRERIPEVERLVNLARKRAGVRETSSDISAEHEA